MKSHRIWPIWKPIPINFSNLTEFSDHLTTHFMEKHTYITLCLCFSQASYIKIKAFDYLGRGWGGGGFKLIFVKISPKFIKSLPYLADFSPQLMYVAQTGFKTKTELCNHAGYYIAAKMCHLMRLWYFSSSVNSLFKRACAAMQSA